MHSCLVPLALALAGLAADPDDNWPEFRGGGGTGHANAKGLPVRWSEKENVTWKVPVRGKAWSSPVVWGEQIWVTTAPADGKELFALAFDRQTGKKLHDVKVFDNPKPAFCIETNSYASSTPCIEEGRVYVHFGSAGTACLDTATGKKLWERRDLPCNHWRGPASSPILWRDRLCIHFDGYDLQYVVALDKKTGETLWKKDRSFKYGALDGDLKKAYATPAVFDVNGKLELVSPAAFGTIAYDPMTGEEIWKVVHGGMNASARPLFVNGRFLLCTSDGGLGLLAVSSGGAGDVTKTSILWSTKKAVPNRSSPILVGDRLYMISSDGVVSRVDTRTGATLRQERLAGKFWASPIYADGRLYFCNDVGMTYVVDVSMGWKVLAANRLADGFMASPAVAGNALILRTRTHLYCIEQKD
jgi:outer membrane protein assembly factor BamB